jgi:hypothetical protein
MSRQAGQPATSWHRSCGHTGPSSSPQSRARAPAEPPSGRHQRPATPTRPYNADHQECRRWRAPASGLCIGDARPARARAAAGQLPADQSRPPGNAVRCSAGPVLLGPRLCSSRPLRQGRFLRSRPSASLRAKP